MFIYSLKGSTLKFIAVVIISIGLLITLVSVLPGNSDNMRASAAADGKKVSFRNISTNDDRVAFLSQYGWQVDKDPIEVVDVIIPKAFDTVFNKYNSIQRQQGMNLEKYKGKTVKRYTYTINNYSNSKGTIYANILIYKDTVVAGDVCTSNANGFMHGLERDNTLLS